MIINRLIIPECNDLNFILNHTENGEKYQLPGNSRYYIIVSKPTEPFEKLFFYTTENEYFNVTTDIPEGEYIFEIGMINSKDARTVILPALDERLRPLNQLLVLRRLSNE